MFEKYKGTDTISPLYDYLKIIFNDKCITKVMCYEYGDNPITFNDILQIAKDNGYKEGVITLICDGALEGKIYQYGNYHDDEDWHEYGSTIGYA